MIRSLFDVIDPELSRQPGFCTTSYDHEGKGHTYREWETDVANPALIKAGYTDMSWRTGDSGFGPLVRICSCLSPTGEQVQLVII